MSNKRSMFEKSLVLTFLRRCHFGILLTCDILARKQPVHSSLPRLSFLFLKIHLNVFQTISLLILLLIFTFNYFFGYSFFFTIRIFLPLLVFSLLRYSLLVTALLVLETPGKAGKFKELQVGLE